MIHIEHIFIDEKIVCIISYMFISLELIRYFWELIIDI
jgi:hypothetical protein